MPLLGAVRYRHPLSRRGCRREAGHSNGREGGDDEPSEQGDRRQKEGQSVAPFGSQQDRGQKDRSRLQKCCSGGQESSNDQEELPCFEDGSAGGQGPPCGDQEGRPEQGCTSQGAANKGGVNQGGVTSKATTTGSTKTASNKSAPSAGSTKNARRRRPKKAPATAKKAAPAAKAAGSAEVPAPRPVKTLGVKPKPLAPVRPKTGPYAKEGKFLEEQTELLVIERDIYQEQATSLRAEADSLALEREPGDVQFDEESGEGGTVTVDRERNLALSGQAALAVEEIDLAMERVADKTYGYCERCYQPIPKPRLRALPYARLCVACKSGGLSRR